MQNSEKRKNELVLDDFIGTVDIKLSFGSGLCVPIKIRNIGMESHDCLGKEYMEYYMEFAVTDKVKNCFEVDRILASGNRTIVFWADGTKTVVRKSDDTPYTPYSYYDAFTAALAKKVYGNNSQVNRIVENNVWEQERNRRTGKMETTKVDLRRMHKAEKEARKKLKEELEREMGQHEENIDF